MTSSRDVYLLLNNRQTTTDCVVCSSFFWPDKVERPRGGAARVYKPVGREKKGGIYNTPDGSSFVDGILAWWVDVPSK
jgi:hypothetical protein